jgi:hypothetical protein
MPKAIQFSVEDLQTPVDLERVLRQFQAAITVAGITGPATTSPSLAAQAAALAPLIGQQLQLGGSSPLNLTGLLSSSGALTEGTHAQRLAVVPNAVNLIYLETDRNALYASENIAGALVWVYLTGTYASTFANRPADLGTHDVGFLFYATDQDSLYIWTGATWDTITKRMFFGAHYAIFAATLASVDRTYTLPDATDTFVLLALAQVLSNKTLGDPSDLTKALAFLLSGATTATTTTFVLSQTGNRSLTFPDATGNLAYETASLTNNNFLSGGGGALVKDSGVAALTLASGTYTPVLTNSANVSASTAYVCQWMRVGSVVSVSGRVDINPTLIATQTQLDMSVPVASAFSAGTQCGGTAAPQSLAARAASISANVSKASFQWVSDTAANDPWYFSFIYQVI